MQTPQRYLATLEIRIRRCLPGAGIYSELAGAGGTVGQKLVFEDSAP